MLNFNGIRFGECEHYYRLGRTLGQGSYATVKSATHREMQHMVAVKIMKKSSISGCSYENLHQEMSILQRMNHPNIVSLYEVVEGKENVCFIMEHMSGGELFDRIQETDQFSESAAKDIVKQILSAVKYCHSLNIVHRDIKPENLLFLSTDVNSSIKLADFGLATLMKPNQMLHKICGTPAYVAPEIVNGKIGYGKPVDIWAVGVICYVLLSGSLPFKSIGTSTFKSIQFTKLTFQGSVFRHTSDIAKNFITRMLDFNPATRMTAEEALNHEWLTSVLLPNEDQTVFDEIRVNLREFNSQRRLKSSSQAIQVAQFMNDIEVSRNSSDDDYMCNISTPRSPFAESEVFGFQDQTSKNMHSQDSLRVASPIPISGSINSAAKDQSSSQILSFPMDDKGSAKPINIQSFQSPTITSSISSSRNSPTSSSPVSASNLRVSRMMRFPVDPESAAGIFSPPNIDDVLSMGSIFQSDASRLDVSPSFSMRDKLSSSYNARYSPVNITSKDISAYFRNEAFQVSSSRGSESPTQRSSIGSIDDIEVDMSPWRGAIPNTTLKPQLKLNVTESFEQPHSNMAQTAPQNLAACSVITQSINNVVDNQPLSVSRLGSPKVLTCGSMEEPLGSVLYGTSPINVMRSVSDISPSTRLSSLVSLSSTPPRMVSLSPLPSPRQSPTISSGIHIPPLISKKIILPSLRNTGKLKD